MKHVFYTNILNTFCSVGYFIGKISNRYLVYKFYDFSLMLRLDIFLIGQFIFNNLSMRVCQQIWRIYAKKYGFMKLYVFH